jgi:hypothetical protein
MSYVISHRIALAQAPEMYKVWRDKKEKVTKIVIFDIRKAQARIQIARKDICEADIRNGVR